MLTTERVKLAKNGLSMEGESKKRISAEDGVVVVVVMEVLRKGMELIEQLLLMTDDREMYI